MHTASRFEFNPPVQRQGMLRAYGLALLIHGLLLAALTWGVSWRSSDTRVVVEAELWSAVPQEAAPALAEPEPAPEPTPPPPPPKVEEPRQSQADIALAREKERQAKEKQAQLEREKLARDKEREQQEREKKLAEEKKKKELEAKQAKLKEQEAAKQREKLRQENLQRMAGLAGATGAPTATGNAQKSSGGISSSYAGRIRARIKPNIVFPDDIATNPSAEVEVRTSPDGTIVGRKLIKSSGVPSWDEAVLKAIDKTDTLPRNEDGQVPSPMTIVFRPKD